MYWSSRKTISNLSNVFFIYFTIKDKFCQEVINYKMTITDIILSFFNIMSLKSRNNVFFIKIYLEIVWIKTYNTESGFPGERR